MTLVRRPPRPPFEGMRENGRRVCPMCGVARTDMRRAIWHRECVELWHYIAFPQYALRYLVETHGRVCWGCGARGPHLFLELEHIRPLWSLTLEERQEHRWWLPFNLQLLCRACHRAKSAREARERYDAQNPDGPAVVRRRELGVMQPLPLELAS